MTGDLLRDTQGTDTQEEEMPVGGQRQRPGSARGPQKLEKARRTPSPTPELWKERTHIFISDFQKP